MGTFRHLILACSALVPIALASPAHGALEPGLRGSILQSETNQAGVTARLDVRKRAIRGLDFAAPRLDEASVDYLAKASTSTGYHLTARQIANSMGFLGNTNGSKVIIGIVDTGVQLNHPQFKNALGASRVLAGTCLAGLSSTLCATKDNKLGGDDSVWPTITHGTHVAGIAAGLTVGIASNAYILPVRVCDPTTGSCPGNIDSGILWASQHGANIINLSLGGTYLTSYDIGAAKTVVGNGSLLVVAAGNAGNSKPTGGYLAGAALYDGVRGGMIVVGALAANNKIASYSQTPGSTCMVQSGHNYCMKNYFVVAPGSAIISSVGGGGLATLSGTSMATPFVSGVAADIKSMWPYLTMKQVANIIFSTAIDLGTPGPDPVYGMGVVDLATALKPSGTVSLVTTTTTTLSTTSTTTSTTSGTAGTASIASDVRSASLSGALSAGLLQSSLLKKVVVVDSFDRAYTADLTKGVRNDGFNLSSFVMLDQLLSTASASGSVGSGLKAVSSTAYSPQLGLVTMSGVFNTVTTPAAFASDGASRDVVRSYATNLAVSASPFEAVSFDMGYKLRLAGRINQYDTDASEAYSGLFLSASAVNSPYVSLTDGGNYAGATVHLADGLSVRSGFSWLAPASTQSGLLTTTKVDGYTVHNPSGSFEQRGASSAVIGVSWNFADWGGLGVVASQTDEVNGVLGGAGSGALNVARSAATSAVDASMRVSLGARWTATLAYGEGLTNLDPQASGILSRTSALRSRSYGIAVATRDVFGDDSLGLALTRPLHIYGGTGVVRAATDVDSEGNLTFSKEQIGFAAATPETDLEVGYTKSFLEGKIALEGKAAYQMDVGAQSGRNAATFVTRLKIAL
jgi:subtilisin family serine protease